MKRWIPLFALLLCLLLMPVVSLAAAEADILYVMEHVAQFDGWDSYTDEMLDDTFHILGMSRKGRPS